MDTIDPGYFAAAAAVVTALCTGLVGLIAAVSAFIVAWRTSRVAARKELTETERVKSQIKTEDRRADLVIRKDEMDLLRGELARQYGVIEKYEQKINALEIEAEEWRRKNAASQEVGIDLTRQLDNARDSIAEQQHKIQDAEEIIRYLIDRERIMRKALVDSGVPVPVMQRRMDEKLANGFNAKLGLVEALNDKSDTGPLLPSSKEPLDK